MMNSLCHHGIWSKVRVDAMYRKGTAFMPTVKTNEMSARPALEIPWGSMSRMSTYWKRTMMMNVEATMTKKRLMQE
jgi:hypothetical protein